MSHDAEGSSPLPAERGFRVFVDRSAQTGLAVGDGPGTRGQDVVVFLAGEADLAAVHAMAEVRDLLLDQSTAAITIDCAQLRFIDCTGLLERLTWSDLARRHGTALSFRSVPSALRRICEVLGIHDLFPIPDRSTGRHNFTSPGP